MRSAVQAARLAPWQISSIHRRCVVAGADDDPVGPAIWCERMEIWMGVRKPFSALIIGGSVGGLAAANELRSIGAEITVYERSADRTQPRGAGIVMQPEVAALLDRLNRSVPSVSVELRQRQHLHRDGRFARYDAPQWMTAWDTLYQAFREPLAAACVRLDSALERVDVDRQTATAAFVGGETARGNVVIGADGIGSTTRSLLTAANDIRYAGYIACRGLEPESAIGNDLLDLLSERFTYFGVPGMQMLCYLVPGPNGERDKGSRRVNWVWYINTPESALEHLLTGTSGRRFDHFLPADEVTPETTTQLTTLAGEALPPQFDTLMRSSRVFLQPVYDLPPTRMVADHIVLIGDAAGTVRPHTASGTSKALGDAAELAHALRGWSPPDPLPDQNLQRWEATRLTHLVEVAGRGMRLAAQSSLGASFGPQFLGD
jgi:2-polyprenyl-6-methoxyphenol hydroxylase-like FAD-dependent oxidoreductase